MKNALMSPLGQKMLSESKFFMGYSRWVDARGSYETWDEAVARVMDMHRDKYAERMTPELEKYFAKAEVAYESQLVLGAQRALQFGGEQLRKHEARMYNCSVSHCDRAAFFQEAMYLLLCGCGVGFSVQKHHVAKLPPIARPSSEKIKVFQIPDSIEGWADAFGVLLSSYFDGEGTFPEYQGHQVHFDFSLIRAKGSEISGGFKAPGPDPLRQALIKCEALLQKALGAAESVAVRPIVAYDFVMHMSDAVLAGGVRRSATICLFDKDDQEMMKAKTGDWFVDNPQRGRSNNSVVLLRDELTREEWAQIMTSVRDFGEPGFIFVDDKEFAYNPCVEIGMRPVTIDGVSGFQFCNLTEINGGKCVNKELFFAACEAGAILGTLQAGYTNFKYVSEATRRITERESLIGVSITGWMNNPHILFDEAILKEGAEIVKRVNREVAMLIGVNPAARTTCAKPSGNASVLLGTASGIHGEHSPMYFRNVQMNADDEVAKLILQRNPKMVEKSVWSANGSDIVVSFPVVSKDTSIFKQDLMGVRQLEFVKKAQQHWVENGTNVELCVHPKLRHNISNTIGVDDWSAVEQYIFDNRQWFAGISLLAGEGDKAYPQAPFTEVTSAEQIVGLYGEASMFASGLIVDGLHAFNDNLWMACDTAMGKGLQLSDEDSKDLLKRDWVRRFKKFAKHFDGDMQKASFCLKDCYNLHKWVGIQTSLQDIDFASVLSEVRQVDINTLGSQACAGGMCEVSFN
ncbi:MULTISPECIES: recombinase [unclassified Variovorax]|nr:MULTISPECIES: recombinase [unclassified Variovorax]PNG50088.1 Adenosylcobalamin-dependent ribonucleoside-triphosphate reductase [Variovorax sp. B2]PNG50960.1 Adenosylcobalamin-dependent ribonucleoside-triphosphate reductase [Variovorax sp. B4]VTU41760.1 Adenosylcobalamin-dependent ribonucleoside-triphosphate reductase [Variovorax sp. SRS16]VTU44640.1 Adenosylcobalamin-dependent ribonucleoside-triphosphate reductase [Variovorax sp. PBL-H6]VTV17120.1 Adenosylcobalamin-dependent ribonucleoside